MKKIISTVALLATLCPVFAQKKEIPAFGKIEKAELQNLTCSYDPGAPAEVIFQDGETSCQIIETASYYVISTNQEIHVRIKILNSKGTDQANVKLVYYSVGNQDKILNITAQTYNLDETGNIVVTKMDKKSIYEKKIDKKRSEVTFTLPEVKVGSVIEYKYTVTTKGWTLPDWYFQKSIPVRLSRYLVEIPKDLYILSTPYCSLPFEEKQEDYSRSYGRIFTMKNIPGLPEEPYMTTEDDYLQRIDFRFSGVETRSGRQSLLKTWPERIKELMLDEDFGLQLRKNIPHTADLDEMIKKETDPFKKMERVFHYVQKNMEWNGVRSKWAFDGVKSAWEKKKGTSGEINLILVNLLKDAGLDAAPILVSTLDNGMVNTLIAGTTQFNTVMAYCSIDGKTYVMDATDPYTPASMIPPTVINTQGLLIYNVQNAETYGQGDWGWITLSDDHGGYSQQVAIQSTVQSDGTISGEALVSQSGYARIKNLKDWTKDGESFKSKHYLDPYEGVKIDQFEVGNEKNDSMPFTQKFKFTLPLQSSGDYQYFRVNLFSGLEKNPFLSEKRSSDIFFGYKQQYTIYGRVVLPDGYGFEELPKNMRMIMPDTSISLTRIFEADGNTLGMRITVDFRRPYYLIDEYPYFREFYKKLFDVLNEQIVVKKTRP